MPIERHYCYPQKGLHECPVTAGLLQQDDHFWMQIGWFHYYSQKGLHAHPVTIGLPQQDDRLWMPIE